MVCRLWSVSLLSLYSMHTHKAARVLRRHCAAGQYANSTLPPKCAHTAHSARFPCVLPCAFAHIEPPFVVCGSKLPALRNNEFCSWELRQIRENKYATELKFVLLPRVKRKIIKKQIPWNILSCSGSFQFSIPSHCIHFLIYKFH